MSATLYDEKRQLVEMLEKSQSENADLRERIDHAYRFISELTADNYIESDYPKEHLSEILYGRSIGETSAVGSE